MRLFETYLAARLETYAKDREELESTLSYRESIALKFRTEQKILIESHLKCVRLRLKLLRSSDDLTVSELLKYDRGSLDESTMAEIILYVLRCVGKLHCIPACAGSDHDDFAVESVMGVVNQ